MAISNFIPTVWSARVNRGLEEQYVYGNIVNRNYEGDIRAYGSTVKINGIGAITVDDYVPNTTVITPEILTDSTQSLVIDQAKYFAFYVDDVDNAQSNPKLMDEAVRKASRGLAAAADTFISSTVAAAVQAGTVNQLNAGAIAYTDVLKVFANTAELLNEDNASQDGRFIVVPAWFESLMIHAGIETATDNTGILSNGFVGRFMGFEVYRSNSTPTVGATPAFGTEGDSVIIAGTREGFTFAEQLMRLEAYRPESSFADAVKGLHLYGGKIVNGNALVGITASKAV